MTDTRDLAQEMLSILEAIDRNEVVMYSIISSALYVRIKKVVKEAHGS